MMVFKVFSPCKTIFKDDINLLILPELMSLWCLYYNIWTLFLTTSCTWSVRSSHLEELFKKGVLKNFTTFTRKHLRRGLFYNKVAGWRPVTLLNTKSGRGAFLWILRNLSWHLFCKRLQGPASKEKVSFRKILSFYYKWNRQLFY